MPRVIGLVEFVSCVGVGDDEGERREGEKVREGSEEGVCCRRVSKGKFVPCR